MATFIPQVQANLPEVKLYTPPFEMIANFLDVKQQRYDAAASQLGTYYSKIKQLPLTVDANIEKRDKFLKEAEAQVKKLAEVDLSLPENYKAARSIFTPLLEDEDIMTDLTFTLKANSLVRANNAFKNSSEEEDRKRYNPNNDAYVSLKLNEFKMSDPNSRKALAQESFNFVANVNLFQKYLDITKGRDYEIDTTKAPSVKGVLMPFYIKSKNGKEITPTTYAALSRVFNQDPEVQAYYQQKGYINVQSELQSLIPEVGYDAAVDYISGKYKSDASIRKALTAAESVKEQIEANEQKKEALENKISREGAVPGSKAHREYLDVLRDLDAGLAEHTALVEESKGMSLQPENISDLYKNAGEFFYQDDLLAAATDYAVRKSSVDIEATPNYASWLESRENGLTGGTAGSSTPGGGGSSLLSTDTAPLTYTGADPAKYDKNASERNEEKLQQRQEQINEGLVQVLGTIAIERNRSKPGQQANEVIRNTGIRDVQTAQAWYDRISASKTKGSQINQMINYLNTMVEDGTLEELYPNAYDMYQSWKNQSSGHAVIEQANAKSYQSSVKSAKELYLSDPNTRPWAELFDILYDPKTGIKSKEAYNAELARLARSNSLPPVLNAINKSAVKPSFNSVVEAAYSIAENDYLQSLPQNKRTVPVTDNAGNTISMQTAWEALSDEGKRRYTEPLLKSYKIWERYPAERGSDNGDMQIGQMLNNRATEAQSFARQADKFYDAALAKINEYYNVDPSSTSVTQMIYPGAVNKDGAADAIEYVSTNISVKPLSEIDNEYAKNEQSILLDNLRRGIQNNKIAIKTGGFDAQDVDAYERGNLTADKNQERQAYTVFNTFKDDLNTLGDAKSSASVSSPRATLKVLPSVPLEVDGRIDNTTIVEITYNDGYLRSITSTAENTGLKLPAASELRQAVMFIPEEEAMQMNIPSGKVIDDYTAFVNNGQYDLSYGGNTASLYYDKETNTISYNATYVEMNPETGKSKTIKDNGAYDVDGNALDFLYLKNQLTQQLKDLKVRNEQITAMFNESNGGTFNPEDLK